MSARIKVSPEPVRTYIDRSGTTTGATQQVAAANRERNGLIIQNISDTDMYVNVGAAAAAAPGSFLIPAEGGYWEAPLHGVPLDAINLFCAVASKEFTAKEW